MKYILTWVLVMLVAWAIAAFVSLTPNPLEWLAGSRLIYCALGVVIIIVILDSQSKTPKH